MNSKTLLTASASFQTQHPKLPVSTKLPYWFTCFWESFKNYWSKLHRSIKAVINISALKLLPA